jgi:predicted nuclease of predicted toxin-antitoxin system
MASPTSASREVKLLLDEMHSPTIADALAKSSWDVVAAASTPDLRGMPDSDLLAYVTADGRAVVTENIVDFALLTAQWAAENRPHAGLIYTNPKRFNRATLAYPGNLIGTLRTFLNDPPIDGESWTWWL